MQYGFFFDNTRCTGCKTCELACKDYKGLDASRTYRRVIDYEGGTWETASDGSVTQNCFAYHISLACNHCSDPACTHVCPTGAMHKDELGLVWPDETKCIGCGYCTMACPYHAPVIDQVSKKSSKCDGCRDRLTEGKKPICVEACPLRALDFAETSELRGAHPNCSSSILPLAAPEYTRPNLFIDVSDAAAYAAEHGGGHIANYSEIE
ncbi:DMSO/selenate family reductase complex B subunit [Raoultibacter phocaeensis]|uniref:DMSO/selenate family reductase complex B subunit n=1 Tax=Raoultibacter phocaeensis TaxID=2479841 RepID=UPI00111A9787|nr:DMSO/selenate family reductase complex B subunit [Raoultibacter phocaeensis]